MGVLEALERKYPNAGFVLVANVYPGLRAIKDNGSGSEMPDPDNMITEEEYNEAIAEFEVFDGWVKVRKQRNQLLGADASACLRNFDEELKVLPRKSEIPCHGPSPCVAPKTVRKPPAAPAAPDIAPPPAPAPPPSSATIEYGS